MAVTIRLKPELHEAAVSYAAELGISLNSLVGLALRDYLMRAAGRERAAVSRSRSEQLPPASAGAPAPASPVAASKRPAGMSRAEWRRRKLGRA